MEDSVSNVVPGDDVPHPGDDVPGAAHDLHYWSGLFFQVNIFLIDTLLAFDS